VSDYPKPIPPPDIVQELATAVGGTITECAALPDGSGFALMSMPLLKTHWLYADDGTYEPPPMGLRDLWLGYARDRVWSRQELHEVIRDAAKFAIRAATMKGKEIDFDPDAMVQNFVVGLLGYHTPNGLSADAWANPLTPTGPPPSADAVDPNDGSTGTPSTRDEDVSG